MKLNLDANWINAALAAIAIILTVIIARRQIWRDMGLDWAWIKPKLAAIRQEVRRLLAVAREELQTAMELWRNRKRLLEILRNPPAVPVAASVPVTPKVVAPTPAPVVTFKTAPPTPIPVAAVTPKSVAPVAPAITPKFVPPNPMPVPYSPRISLEEIGKMAALATPSAPFSLADFKKSIEEMPMVTADNLGAGHCSPPVSGLSLLLAAAAPSYSTTSPTHDVIVAGYRSPDNSASSLTGLFDAEFRRKYPSLFSSQSDSVLKN